MANRPLETTDLEPVLEDPEWIIRIENHYEEIAQNTLDITEKNGITDEKGLIIGEESALVRIQYSMKYGKTQASKEAINYYLSPFFEESFFGILEIIDPPTSKFLYEYLKFEFSNPTIEKDGELLDCRIKLQFESLPMLATSLVLQFIDEETFNEASVGVSTMFSYYFFEKHSDDDNSNKSIQSYNGIAIKLLNRIMDDKTISLKSIVTKDIQDMEVSANKDTDMVFIFSQIFHKYFADYAQNHFLSSAERESIIKTLGTPEAINKYLYSANIVSMALQAKELKKISKNGVQLAAAALRSMRNRYIAVLKELDVEGRFPLVNIAYPSSEVETAKPIPSVFFPADAAEAASKVAIRTDTILARQTIFGILAILANSNEVFRSILIPEINNKIEQLGTFASALIGLTNDATQSIHSKENSVKVQELFTNLSARINNMKYMYPREVFKEVNERIKTDLDLRELVEHYIPLIYSFLKDASKEEHDELNTVLDTGIWGVYNGPEYAELATKQFFRNINLLIPVYEELSAAFKESLQYFRGKFHETGNPFLSYIPNMVYMFVKFHEIYSHGEDFDSKGKKYKTQQIEL